MSKKEKADLIDFHKILEELEKIPFDNPEDFLNRQQSLREQFLDLKERAAVDAKKDINSIFYNAVSKNVETLDGIPHPLTKEESMAFDRKHEQTVQKVNLLKSKINFVKETLRNRIKKENEFTLDLNNRIATKKAAKRFFSERKDSITYDDYVKAREYKSNQNEKEVDDLMEEED